MTSYIERRNQWWKLMQEFGLDIPDHIRGDYLLEMSGLSPAEKTTILVATDHSTTYDVIKKQLLRLHGTNTSKITAVAPSKGKGGGKWKFGQRRQAYHAADDEQVHQDYSSYPQSSWEDPQDHHYADTYSAWNNQHTDWDWSGEADHEAH